MTAPARLCPLCDGAPGLTDFCPACAQTRSDGWLAVRELVAWASRVSPRRPIVEAEWVREALETGVFPDLGEHRKSVV